MQGGLSFAEQHRLTVLAARQQGQDCPPAAELPLARTMRHKLSADRARLKQIASMQAKSAIKAELVQAYMPYLDGVMAAGGGDEVLTQVMVWAFDAGQMNTMWQLASHALDHGLNLPGEFSRPLHAWLAESVAKWTIAALESGQEVTMAAIMVEQRTASMDMHDQIRAKLHHACGLLLEAINNPELALEHYRSALLFDSHCRVKTRIKFLEKAFQSPQEPAADSKATAMGTALPAAVLAVPLAAA